MRDRPGSGIVGKAEIRKQKAGAFADADTTIEELYYWEFDGPCLRDFTGHKPAGARRDAGALEKVE